MYHRDQKAIQRYALENADNMARVYTFVLLTIQQQLSLVGDAMRDVDNQGVESRFLWGFKDPAYTWLQENKHTIYDNSLDVYDKILDEQLCEYLLLNYFSRLPGLGIVKGGFMVQLCFGMSGCIDTHNLKRMGIDPATYNATSFKRSSVKRQQETLDSYMDMIHLWGGSEQMWNDWCQYVADKLPDTFDDADHVSRVHWEAIGGNNVD